MQYARISTHSSDDPDALMAGFDAIFDNPYGRRSGGKTLAQSTGAQLF